MSFFFRVKATSKGLLEGKCRYQAKRHIKATKETKYKMKKRTSTATSSAAVQQIDDATAIRNLEFMKNASVRFQKEEIVTTYKNLYAHRHHNALQNAENVIKDYGNVLRFFRNS
ncbi:hypothetical protein DMENIID0001_163420 [Sergentomyia squamirostris]